MGAGWLRALGAGLAHLGAGGASDSLSDDLGLGTAAAGASGLMFVFDGELF